MDRYKTYWIGELGLSVSTRTGGVRLDIYSPGPPKRMIVRYFDYDQVRALRDWMDERLKEQGE